MKGQSPRKDEREQMLFKFPKGVAGQIRQMAKERNLTCVRFVLESINRGGRQVPRVAVFQFRAAPPRHKKTLNAAP